MRRHSSMTRRYALRPEHVLLLERLVRNELILQRRLGAARRTASARLSALRCAGFASASAIVRGSVLPIRLPEAA
jgi:hypothetical protein